MTYGTGPRRRPRGDASPPPPAGSADGDWLAGLRPSPDAPDDGFEPPRARRAATDGDDRPRPNDPPSLFEAPRLADPPRASDPVPMFAPRAAADPPRRPPGPGPLPDEQPIFRRLDPHTPDAAPPAPREEPILRYIEPRPRTNGTSRRAGSYGGRRRTPAPATVDPVVATDPGEITGSGFGRANRTRGASAAAAAAAAAPVSPRPAPDPRVPRFAEPDLAPDRRYAAEERFAPERPVDRDAWTQPIARVTADPRIEPPRFAEPEPRFAEPEPRFAEPEPRFADRRYDDPRGAEPRYDDPRYEDPRVGDPRFDDPRFDDPRYADARVADPRFDDPRVADPRYDDPRFEDPRVADPRYDDPRVADPRYDDPRFADPRFEDPRLADPRYADARVADPRYDDPRVADPRYDDPRFADPRFEDPRLADPRFEDPRLADPRLADPRFEDPRFEAGPVRPRQPDELGPPRAAAKTDGGMRPVRPDTTGGMRAVRPDTTGGIPRVRTESADGMRPVRPDTTGSIPRIRPDSTGGIPRVVATPTGPVRVDPVQAQRPRSRWLVAMSTVGVLVLLAVCGLGTYFIVKDEQAGSSDARKAGDATGSPNVPRRDISNRAADPAPLTEAEVFPGPQVPAGAGQPPYQVLKLQTSADCAVAAADDLGKLLATQGCNQVVRATLKTVDGSYLITAGVFNLNDEQGALQAHENIKPTIDASKGRFTGLLAGAGTEALVKAPMILGWHARGHFLAYCIVARADGRNFETNDAVPDKIQSDVLTNHLRDGIIGARTVGKTGVPASAAPAPS